MRNPFSKTLVLSFKTAAFVLLTSIALPLHAADDGKDAELFRSIFYSYAKAEFSDAEIQKLIFQPRQEFFAADEASSDGVASLKKRSEAWSKIKPVDLYNDGKSPVSEVLDLDKALEAKPVTIVVIPGIFGEFITHSPFDEVFKKQDSSFSKEWAHAFNAKPLTDPVFDLETMANSEKKLSEIIEVASIDNAAGKAVIRLIYMKPLIGSLETLGTLEDSSKLYLRRMNKVWDVLGPQENLYILGYSRGLNVALDFVNRAEAKREGYPWLSNLKGIVSLGGTLYGSAIADATITPGQYSCKAIERLEALANALVVLPPQASMGEKIKAVAKNSKAWASAAADLMRIGGQIPPAEGLEVENIQTDGPDIGAFGQLLKTFAFEKFKITQGSEYSNNVEKFKLMIREAREGINTLTEVEGLAWVKAHTISPKYKYFVIQGTMADPSSRESGKSLLAEDSASFNTKTLDYKALRRSYYDYFVFHGMSLNDSQISPDRSIFWPALHKSLNPKQEDFEARLITILGTDHWGMSFPVALESRNQEISPFPREVLVKSLGAFLAKDLSK
jgi:hypothetical protein